MSEQPEARSPFRLLEEAEGAKELLVLSYTTNLDFFERFALSEARALGAVVTLVSDARMVSADPGVVRRAGTAYLDARAVCPAGAFHPKLVVLAGAEEARVAIGSGNLTLAGWHGNAEIWTLLRGDRDGGPATLAEVAAFLRDLDSSAVRLTVGASEALQRVAAQLDGIPSSQPGPRLLHNLSQPIVEQLPRLAVDELLCSAPFYDSELSALGNLIERFSPRALAIHLESRTSVDGPALLELLGERGEIHWTDEERYHHGKLIEWAADGRRWSLSGSPNLSWRALLGSVPAGGNCELALLSEVEGSRAPRGGEPPGDGAAGLTLDRDEAEAEPGPLLLGAVQVEGTVGLLLHRPAERDGWIQAYDTEADAWRQIATLAAGEDAYEISSASAPAATALRIKLDDGTVSNEVFVTDLKRVRRAQAVAVGKALATPQEVAIDGLGAALLADVEELRGHLLRVGALVPIGTASAGEESDEDLDRQADLPSARPASGQTLEDYLAACEPVLGREMTEFALVLPALPGLGGDFDASLAGLESDLDDEEEPGDDEESAAGLSEVLGKLPDRERDRWRRWVERLVERAPELSMVIRTLALRSVLHGIAEGIWTEERWPEILAAATGALAVGGDEPGAEERAAAASLGAIAVALLCSEVERLSVRDEQALRYEAAATAVAPLLPDFDPERVEMLAPEMPEPLRGGAALEACLRVVEDALEPPSGAEHAVWLLDEEHGIEAWLDDDGAIELERSLPAVAEPQLCLALGLAREPGPLVARGTIEGRVGVVAVWAGPYLVVERSRGERRWGRLFRLPDSLSPLNFASLDRELPAPVASWEGDRPPPQAARNLLRLAAPRALP